MTVDNAGNGTDHADDWSREALASANVGLWGIEIERRSGKIELQADAVTRKLLGVGEDLPSDLCVAFWRDRVDSRYRAQLTELLNKFYADTSLHEVRYLYNHPRLGLLSVRAGGRRTSGKQDPVVRIVGYHQDMTDLHEAHQSLREGLLRLSLACRLGWLGVFEMGRAADGTLTLTGNDVFYEQFALSGIVGTTDRLEIMAFLGREETLARLQRVVG